MSLKKRFVQSIYRFLLRHPFLFKVSKVIYVQKIVHKPMTKIFGPLFRRSRNCIEIDITYVCNLRCINCNRSCAQAPSNEQMSVNQIKKFIEESIVRSVRWKRIRVLGGEPTLHTDILEILDLFLKYKKDHSPDTIIQLCTNGYGKKVRSVLAKVPAGIDIENTEKTTGKQSFWAFNLAPRDFLSYKFADFSRGCSIMSDCGMGLTPYGYYACAAAGGIDKIFGFNIGTKKLPPFDDDMADQLHTLCRYCGIFRGKHKCYMVDTEIMSASWKKAYVQYKAKRPRLSPY